MQLNEQFVIAVDLWFEAIRQAELAGDLFLRLEWHGRDYGTPYSAALDTVREHAAAVVALADRLAPELARRNQDAVGVLRAGNLAGEICERMPMTKTSAAWLREAWPDVKSRLQAVALLGGEVATKTKMTSEKRKPGRRKRGVLNGEMLDTLQNNGDSRGWSCGDWAKALKCHTSQIVGLAAWISLEDFRRIQKIQRQKDRHGRGVLK